MDGHYVIIPDLRDKFIIGAGGTGFKPPKAEGGSANSIIPAHTHTGSIGSAGAHTHTGSTGGAGNHVHQYRSWDEKVSTDFNTFEGQFNSIDIFNGGDKRRKERPTSVTMDAGAHSHGLNINSYGNHTHTVTINSTGVSGINANLPPYYTLAYIIRITLNSGETFTENTELLTAVNNLATTVTNITKPTITFSRSGFGDATNFTRIAVPFNPPLPVSNYRIIVSGPANRSAGIVTPGGRIRTENGFTWCCNPEINMATINDFLLFDFLIVHDRKILADFYWSRKDFPITS